MTHEQVLPKKWWKAARRAHSESHLINTGCSSINR